MERHTQNWSGPRETMKEKATRGPLALSVSCGTQRLWLPPHQLEQTELFCRAGRMRPQHLARPWDGCGATCLIPCCRYLMTSECWKTHCFVQDTLARAVGHTQGGDCCTWFLTITSDVVAAPDPSVSPGVWVYGNT